MSIVPIQFKLNRMNSDDFSRSSHTPTYANIIETVVIAAVASAADEKMMLPIVFSVRVRWWSGYSGVHQSRCGGSGGFVRERQFFG